MNRLVGRRRTELPSDALGHMPISLFPPPLLPNLQDQFVFAIHNVVYFNLISAFVDQRCCPNDAASNTAVLNMIQAPVAREESCNKRQLRF